MKAITPCSHFKKRLVNMVLLKDLTFPDSGRLLQGPGPRGSTAHGSTSDDSGRRPLAISVAGAGLILLFAIWCIRTSCVRSGSATRVVNVTSAPVPPPSAPVPLQDERAGDAMQSTLQRKHAILELFRASQVTMVSYEVYPL